MYTTTYIYFLFYFDFILENLTVKTFHHFKFHESIYSKLEMENIYKIVYFDVILLGPDLKTGRVLVPVVSDCREARF